MKAKQKTTVFRPTVPDESGALRRNFSKMLKKSGMTRPGFAYKVIEAGLRVMSERAEVRP